MCFSIYAFGLEEKQMEKLQDVVKLSCAVLSLHYHLIRHFLLFFFETDKNQQKYPGG